MAGNNDFFNDFPATGHNLLISTLGKPYRVSEKYAKVKDIDKFETLRNC